MKTSHTVLLFQALLGLTLSSAQASLDSTPNQELKARFDSAKAHFSSMNELEGAYLGRCFNSDSDQARGMILATRVELVGESNGPLYPAKQIWKMDMIERTIDGKEAPAADNDSVTQKALNQYWAHPQGSVNGIRYDVYSEGVTFSSDEVSSLSTGHVTVSDQKVQVKAFTEVKKGSDGFLYVKLQDSFTLGAKSGANPAVYCYFWKKLPITFQ